MRVGIAHVLADRVQRSRITPTADLIPDLVADILAPGPTGFAPLPSLKSPRTTPLLDKNRGAGQTRRPRTAQPFQFRKTRQTVRDPYPLSNLDTATTLNLERSTNSPARDLISADMQQLKFGV